MQLATSELNRRLQGRAKIHKLLSCGEVSYGAPGRITKMICRRLVKLGWTEANEFTWWAMELVSGEVWMSNDSGYNWEALCWTEE